MQESQESQQGRGGEQERREIETEKGEIGIWDRAREGEGEKERWR